MRAQSPLPSKRKRQEQPPEKKTAPPKKICRKSRAVYVSKAEANAIRDSLNHVTPKFIICILQEMMEDAQTKDASVKFMNTSIPSIQKAVISRLLKREILMKNLTSDEVTADDVRYNQIIHCLAGQIGTVINNLSYLDNIVRKETKNEYIFNEKITAQDTLTRYTILKESEKQKKSYSAKKTCRDVNKIFETKLMPDEEVELRGALTKINAADIKKAIKNQAAKDESHNNYFKIADVLHELTDGLIDAIIKKRSVTDVKKQKVAISIVTKFTHSQISRMVIHMGKGGIVGKNDGKYFIKDWTFFDNFSASDAPVVRRRKKLKQQPTNDPINDMQFFLNSLATAPQQSLLQLHSIFDSQRAAMPKKIPALQSTSHKMTNTKISQG